MKTIYSIIIAVFTYPAFGQTIFTQPITATTAYLGGFGSVTLQIDDAHNDGLITKPLIVAEGFDSGLLGIENEFGENDIVSFSRSVNDAGSIGLENFLTGGTNITFGDQDYDIIYVNWDKGNDYLQRNAFALEAVITWVNSVKMFNVQNVVLGQSMGGVIARYALADMEQRSLPHDTSLYISHDAPHQGANIPLSIQFMARHVVDQFVTTPVGSLQIELNGGGAVSIQDIQALLNAPGTQQLLAFSVTPSFGVSSSVHEAWQTDLKSKGYPQLTRNIAISNGSHCANPQEINPLQVLFSLNGDIKTSTLTDLLTGLIGQLGVYNGLAYTGLAFLFNEPGLLLGVIPGNSKFNFDFQAKALPNANAVAQVYKGKITFTKKILFLVNVPINLTNKQYDNNYPETKLAFDSYPGGFYPVPFDFTGTTLGNAFYNANISVSTVDSFNFIPSPSALDVGGDVATLNNSDYIKKYNAVTPPVGSKAIPFANFTTSLDNGLAQINEPHISFNTRNGNWLALELNTIANDEQQFDCTFVCDDIEINGSPTLCGAQSYSLVSGATSYSWTVTTGSSLVTISGATTNTVTITRAVSPLVGNIVLSLTLGSPDCGTRTLTKTIWVGPPSFPQLVTNSGFPYNDTMLPAGCADGMTHWTFKTANPLDRTSSFQFSRTGGATITKNTNTGQATVTAQELGIVQGQIVDLIVKPINECGYLNKVFKFKLYRPTDCECGIGVGCDINIVIEPNDTSYRIYPNPTNDVINIVTISTTDPKTTSDSSSIVTLNNMMGEEKNRAVFRDGVSSISVRNLPTGIYLLKIIVNGKVESHKVIVN